MSITTNTTVKASNREALRRASLDGAACGGYTQGNRRPRRPARNCWLAGFPFWAARTLQLLLLVVGLGLLSACGPTANSSPTETIQLEATPTRAESTPEPTATAERPDASAAEGRLPVLGRTPAARSCRQGPQVENGTLESDSVSRPFPYRVVLPPCYAARPGLDYPTVYLLHGLTADHDQWISFGLVENVERLMGSGEINPFLIVLPWHRTGIELESAFVAELMPHIEAGYRVRAEGHWRAIGGLSRGAGWAFRIGFKHPDRFRAVGLHSPALMDGDLFAAERWLEAHPSAQPPDAWVDIGDRDPLLESVPGLLDRLEELGVEYHFAAGSGWHDTDYWSANTAAYLRWYGSHW